MLEPLPAIRAIELFREVDEALIPLLRGLDSDDWNRPAVGTWKVCDVAAHLLDSALRRLSLDRDRHQPPPPDHDLSDYRGLVDFLNHLNATWVDAASRFSPRVITDLLEIVDPQVADYLESLDPEAPAAFTVDWAGQDESLVWMDVAREFTERWHHQQQIREAVGAPGLDEPRFVVPLLETLMRAVPRAYESVSAQDGTSISIEIDDLDGLAWVLIRDSGRWVLRRPTGNSKQDASINLPADIAWRLLVKGIPAETALRHAALDGDSHLTRPFFASLAVMA
jgi:hypothetical protein